MVALPPGQDEKGGEQKTVPVAFLHCADKADALRNAHESISSGRTYDHRQLVPKQTSGE